MPFISGYYGYEVNKSVNWEAPAGQQGWWDRYSMVEASGPGWAGATCCPLLACIGGTPG